MPDEQSIMEAYSYRVSARFGSRVAVAVGDSTVSITGPRLGLAVYRLWVASQAILIAVTILALVAALILWEWRYVVGAVLLLLTHLAVSGFGAGCLWEFQNLNAFLSGNRGPTASFPLDTVERVKVGRGWARRGMWLLILPYVGGINQLAKGFCVSFEAPDGETGREVVYALHMQTTEDAQRLARLLEGNRAS